MIALVILALQVSFALASRSVQERANHLPSGLTETFKAHIKDIGQIAIPKSGANAVTQFEPGTCDPYGDRQIKDGFLINRGVADNGGSYESPQAASIEACLDLCNRDQQCQFAQFTWTEGRCHLKNSVRTLSERPGSDLLTRLHDGSCWVFGDGNSYNGFIAQCGYDSTAAFYKKEKASNIKSCIDHCHADPKCRAASFYAPAEECYMRETVGTRVLLPWTDLVTPHECQCWVTEYPPDVTSTCVATSSTSIPLPAPTTFRYTGGNQEYVVPVGVSALMVEAYGAGGCSGTGGGRGGRGGFVSGQFSVQPGEKLQITVGGSGGTGEGRAAYGRGGYGATGNQQSGGAGGGMSGIWRSAPFQGEPIALAAGGGGGPGSGNFAGGDGGGLAGANAMVGNGNGGFGTGGTQISSGFTFGGKYTGGFANGYGPRIGGGGGGAGYYGGGGGTFYTSDVAPNGGGGGSSRVQNLRNSNTRAGGGAGYNTNGWLVLTPI